jgi:micrococcal nuclease
MNRIVAPVLLSLGAMGLGIMGLGGCQANSTPPDRQLVQVQGAITGHTVAFSLAGVQGRVRLVGLQAPGLNQKPWGPAARDRLEQILKESGQEFFLELAPKAANTPENYQYGYLWRGSTLINAQMLREGHGVAVIRYAKYEQQLVQAQYYARMVGVGIWNREAPLREDPRTPRKATTP